MESGFKVGSRVRLKVSNPPCCGVVDPRKYGEIVNKVSDGAKWSVHLEGEDKPRNIREQDLELLDE